LTPLSHFALRHAGAIQSAVKPAHSKLRAIDSAASVADYQYIRSTTDGRATLIVGHAGALLASLNSQRRPSAVVANNENANRIVNDSIQEVIRKSFEVHPPQIAFADRISFGRFSGFTKEGA
jgi:hypothetical protein